MLPELDLLDRIIPIARAAGTIVMEVYATEFKVEGKGDASPVTEADHRAEALVLPALARITPGLQVVSEEAASAGRIPVVAERFWLVDPLDGTREFVNRNGEFTVNIALVERDTPVLGVVLAPASGRLFAGAAGAGAFVEDESGRRQAITCRRIPATGLTVVSSRSHGDLAALDAFLTGRVVASHVTAGSSLKFCLVAGGQADLYPRFGRTMEWDTAAGHAILRAAGGCVTDLNGAELRYGKPDFANPHFVAMGRQE
ncbi:MAG: 3'(2'),5'-bisphosphate nucleotidase CysQ [Betaproteobacteria bacterium]|nr:MAG: 3'(2'),5'-bisphosphate nucleotidase CysQ [Betaproteobacteria bacterium]TMH54872.1 MAG: 3'(2'),5'-bisphosphate nucleotidase CysQ [Betaproteobacteria bacterium]